MKLRLIAIALAACVAPALATTTASVTTGSLDYTLKDLNGADGVTASLTWDPSWYMQVSWSISNQVGYEIVDLGWGKGLEPKFDGGFSSFGDAYSPLKTAAANLGSLGSASVSLDAVERLSAAANVAVTEGQMASISASFSRGFTLAAGTQVSFSVLADRNLTGSAYTGTWTPPSGLDAWDNHSHSAASLTLSVGATNFVSYLSGSNGLTYSPDAYEVVGDADQIKVTVRNNTAASQSYSLYFSAGLNVQENLDPATAAVVPEPSSYALMALGLAGVGIAVRRRRS